jgi:hypothetical protein
LCGPCHSAGGPCISRSSCTSSLASVVLPAGVLSQVDFADFATAADVVVAANSVTSADLADSDALATSADSAASVAGPTLGSRAPVTL